MKISKIKVSLKTMLELFYFLATKKPHLNKIIYTLIKSKQIFWFDILTEKLEKTSSPYFVKILMC